MSELGGVIAIALGLILVIGGFKGTLLKSLHVIDTGIGPRTQSLLSFGSPGPGAPGSGVTTQ